MQSRPSEMPVSSRHCSWELGKQTFVSKESASRGNSMCKARLERGLAGRDPATGKASATGLWRARRETAD